jgi:hypothetical protein
MLGVGDSPAWLGDVYVGMSLIAQNTSNCRELLRSPVAGMGNRSVNFGISRLIPKELRPKVRGTQQAA